LTNGVETPPKSTNVMVDNIKSVPLTLNKPSSLCVALQYFYCLPQVTITSLSIWTLSITDYYLKT